MIISIGSSAAHIWHPDKWPEPNDTDYLCNFDTFAWWLEQHKEQAEAYFPIDEGKKYIVYQTFISILETSLKLDETEAYSQTI